VEDKGKVSLYRVARDENAVEPKKERRPEAKVVERGKKTSGVARSSLVADGEGQRKTKGGEGGKAYRG
jgi:hypothetical protein